MTARDRINLLLQSPPDQIDSQEFWAEQIRHHISTTDASDLENLKLLDALMFMHHGALLLDQANEVFTRQDVLAFFREHADTWGKISHVRLKMISKNL